MLEAAGRAPTGPAGGFIVGNDTLGDLSPSGRVLAWLQLDQPLFATYSRSSGTAKRSALERYDHEQTFRLKVATTAAHGAPALVRPIFTDECESCQWLDLCRGIEDEDVASAHITSGRLTVREWTALADAGVVTVEDLATLDPTVPSFAEGYLPEVTHVRDPIGRLNSAVRRARMTQDGLTLMRESSGPIRVPRADVEIDLDIEWDTHDRVYLWGALMNYRGEEPTYHPTVAGTTSTTPPPLTWPNCSPDG